MKIRQGFISNSSTSSFIAAVKNGAKAEVSVTFTVDLSMYAENILTSEEDLKNYVKEAYGWSNENFDHYNKVLKLLKSGNRVFIGSFSNESDDIISQFLCDYGLINTKHSSDVEVIEGEGGF